MTDLSPSDGTVQVAWDAEGGFAYVRDHILVPRRDVGAAGELIRARPVREAGLSPYAALSIERRNLREAIVALRLEGIDAQLDHVFFFHGCCCPPTPCAPPAGAGGGLRPDPFRTLPRAVGGPAPTAQQLPQPAPAVQPHVQDRGVRVVVLDTGMPRPNPGQDTGLEHTTGVGAQDTGDNEPAPQGDGYLDEFGGHGTFIAGLIENRVPGVPISLVNVAKTAVTVGPVVNELTVAHAIHQALADHAGEFLLFGLSFGGGIEHAGALHTAIQAARAAGHVVVASAGNDATCLPSYPAAFPGVVSVGAIGPSGPAEFTNFGPWVRCCAPGVDLTSRFFTRNFARPPEDGSDPDDFSSGVARWSGTSFAVPLVIAALVRHMVAHQLDPKQAVAAVIDSPWLGRMPALGTVINI